MKNPAVVGVELGIIVGVIVVVCVNGGVDIGVAGLNVTVGIELSVWIDVATGLLSAGGVGLGVAVKTKPDVDNGVFPLSPVPQDTAIGLIKNNAANIAAYLIQFLRFR